MRPEAQGRLKDRTPVSIIDIGSNSVRLVIYEGISRSPTPLFNEKVMAGLGRGLVESGKLQEKSVERALYALKRFKALSDQADVETIHVIATAAAREAENGPAFIEAAEKIVGVEVHVLTGKEEAYYSAQGIISSFYGADGIVGDLGGGSLELVDVRAGDIGDGITLPIGGLRLADLAGEKLDDVRKIVQKEIARADLLHAGEGRTFYAVGGTWRNLASLHMAANNYPLRIMHDYRVSADEMKSFLKQIIKSGFDDLAGYSSIGKSRRQLLPYGAVVLSEVLEAMKPRDVATSAFGVREGYLYALLQEEYRQLDPLLCAADEMAVLRARSPVHSRELADWTGAAFTILNVDESATEARYRRAACLLADIVWRAHPEYRAPQAITLMANAAFVGIDHPGRVFIALANMFRHQKKPDDVPAPELAALINDRLLYRARLIGLLMRVGYMMSASMPGMLPDVSWQVDDSKDDKDEDEANLLLLLPEKAVAFQGEALDARLSILGKFLGRKIKIKLI